MLRNFGIFVLLISAAGLSACGKKATFDDFPVIKNSPLSFESSVPVEQARLLAEDLEKVGSFDIAATVGNDSGLNAIEDEAFSFGASTPAALKTWLTERVHYVVGEDFKISEHGYYANRLWTYENAQELPELPDGLSMGAIASSSDAKVVMANIGTAVYFKGKQESRLIGLDLGELGNVEIRSPRTGILQIGTGLFDEDMGRYLGGDESAASSIVRLGTLFHEARHSDGHGHTLGFFHVKCPAGHDYAGYYACDRMLNGPYTAGATLVNLLLNSCKECSSSETELLRVVYLDSIERVLSDFLSPEAQQEIKRLEDEKEQQDYIARTSLDSATRADARTRINEIDAEIKAIKESNKPSRWDDAPEGKR